MIVTIRISSTLLGTNTFNQLTMIGQNVQIDGNQITPVKTESATVSIDPSSSLGYVEMAVFHNLDPGNARFFIEGSDDYHWRSGPVVLGTSDQTLNYTLLQAAAASTTFSRADLENTITLPIISSQDSSNNQGQPHEKISAIRTLIIHVQPNTLRFTGNGFYGRRDIFEAELAENAGEETEDPPGIDLTASNFNFTYKLWIVPGNPIQTEGQMLRVVAIEPIQIVFNNPITGFGALFMQNQINENSRQSIEDRINANVQNQIDAQVGGQTQDTDLQARVTANVVQTEFQIDPQEKESIYFNTLISFPTELTAPTPPPDNGEPDSKSGCLKGALVLGLWLQGLA